MSGQIRARLYGTIQIRIPLETTIDLDEFTEWVEESGQTADPQCTDDVLEFIHASPDDLDELKARFPKADADNHDILSFDIDEIEILEVDDSTDGGQ